MLSPEAKEHLDLVFGKFSRAGKAKADARAAEARAAAAAARVAEASNDDKAFESVMRAMATALAEGDGPPRTHAEAARAGQRGKPDDVVEAVLTAMHAARGQSAAH